MVIDGSNDDLHLAVDEADRLLRLIENTPTSAAHQTIQASSQSVGPASTTLSTRSNIPIPAIVLGSLLTGLFAGAFIQGSLSQREILQRQSPSSSNSEPSIPKPLASNEPATQSEPDVATRGRPDESEEAQQETIWSACKDDVARDGLPSQPGETWWPVVGPADSLEAARRHCRPDSFINKSGNVQVASFRDQQVATSVADKLSEDSSHPWRFQVGEPTRR